MHYILLYEVVDDYVEKRAPYRGQHLGLIRQAAARGELVMAGAFAEPADGAMLVFRGPSPEAAEKFAKSDPYVRNGLVTSRRVRKWNTVVGDEAVMPS
jgi:uncharacterized protein YciI